MKKFLGIVVLGMLLSFNANTAEFIKGKLISSDQITGNFLKNKTVTDLVSLGFNYSPQSVTTIDDSVQYYLYRSFDNENVHVLCFVDPTITICKLP